MIDLSLIKKLRKETSLPFSEIKEALEKTGGDVKKAKKILEERAKKVFEKKKEKETKEGGIGIYLHSNKKLGAMVKVLCETDFVAKNEVFQNLLKDLAMQVAAMKPKNVNELLEQDFIKDPQKKVKDIIKEAVFLLKENIKVEDFVFFEI